MRPRSIVQLCELDDAAFFSEIAKGMCLCVANSLRLWRDARRLLSPKRPQGFSILRAFVEEEAAKFHILLDAVRCPRQPPNILSRQLRYFNQHLPKGLYATYYNIFSPVNLQEIRRYMDSERKLLYLDGPNDVDWVFQNDVLRRREEAIYVDFVDYRDAYKREQYWHTPNTKLLEIGLWNQRPKVLEVAMALHGVGLTSERALAIVAKIWRSVPMDDTIQWNDIKGLNLQTLEALDEAGLLRQRGENDYRMAKYDWLFPLFPLDLGPTKVDEEEIQEAQRNWSPW
jgi:AbiV family abortive infection protein